MTTAPARFWRAAAARRAAIASLRVRAVLFPLLLATAVTAAGCGGEERRDEAAGPLEECREVEAPAPRQGRAGVAPDEPLPAEARVTLTFETSCGSFSVELEPRLAPHTTASLVALARAGYFDDTVFHRVVPGFVVQGGDPTQTGAGGPGYSTVDEPPAAARYTRGVVAMAKAGFEAPGTAGSQFFVVTAEDAGLPPDYAIVGRVREGMDTVLRIDALGVGDGPPSRPVVIERVAVSEG